MLILQNLDITLGKGTKLEYHVLQKLNLQVNKGEFIIVIGGNGAGKSTMFNVISGFLKQDSGKIILDGQDITKALQTARSKDISIVMQDPRIGTIENMRIFENMAFAITRGQIRGLHCFANNARKEFFQEKLAILDMGLEHKLDEIVSNLSGGQRQAISLIMAIIAPYKILLLDEITAALDPKMAEIVMQLANKIIREEKLTCIMTTHNMAYAIKYGDRIVLMRKGNFIKEFTDDDKKCLTPEILSTKFDEVQG